MADDERKRAIEAFMEKQRGARCWCEDLRAEIKLEECLERHRRSLLSKVYGGRMSDALASLQDKHCVKTCTRWKKHRAMLQAVRKRKR